jgi:branched-chain amino acid transport system permease protein
LQGSVTGTEVGSILRASVGGAMVGGIIFGLIETFAAVLISTSYKDAIGMILLILILLAWPEGLAGLVRKGR